MNQSTEPISFMIALPKEFITSDYGYSLIRVESDGTVTTLLCWIFPVGLFLSVALILYIQDTK